jgi:hypothetical protein
MKSFNQFLNENKYSIDAILDKINSQGINSLSFYEIQVLENPDIQKKLLYQHKMELGRLSDILTNFNIEMNDDVYVQETFYIDGEIVIGNYDEDKFNDIINKIGKENYIHINRYVGIFEKELDQNKLKSHIMGKMVYSEEIEEQIKAYPIAINFFNNRTEYIFYNKIDDEIIELSSLEFQYKISSAKDVEKYFKILGNILKSKTIIDKIKNDDYFKKI